MSAPHPAVTIIHSGDTPRAIAYLRSLNDPRVLGAIAMLENGYPDYARYILEDLPAHVVARAPEVAA
jgi:hypothetical protein